MDTQIGTIAGESVPNDPRTHTVDEREMANDPRFPAPDNTTPCMTRSFKPQPAHVADPDPSVPLTDLYKAVSHGNASTYLSSSDTLTDTSSSSTACSHSRPVNLPARNAKPHAKLISTPEWSAEFDGHRTLKIDLVKAIQHKNAVLSVKFSPDGKYLAAGCVNGAAYIYDARTGERKRFDFIYQAVFDLLIHAFYGSALKDKFAKDVSVRIVCFSFDNKLLATAGSDHQIRV